MGECHAVSYDIEPTRTGMRKTINICNVSSESCGKELQHETSHGEGRLSTQIPEVVQVLLMV